LRSKYSNNISKRSIADTTAVLEAQAKLIAEQKLKIQKDANRILYGFGN
jgi:hypothetical protein